MKSIQDITALNFSDIVNTRNAGGGGTIACPWADITVAIHSKNTKRRNGGLSQSSAVVIMLRGKTLRRLGWRSGERGWAQTTAGAADLLRIRRTDGTTGNHFQNYGVPRDSVLRIGFACSMFNGDKATPYTPAAEADVLLVTKDAITIRLPESIIEALTKTAAK